MAANSEKNKVLFSVVVLLVISLSLVAYTSKNPTVARSVTGAFVELLSPFQRLLSSAFNWGSGLWLNFSELLDAREENQRLRKELSALKEVNSTMKEVKQENLQFQSILQLKTKSELNGVVAQVIAYSPSNWRQMIVVDRGLSDGIREEMPVVVGDGVVGMVSSVLLKTSSVLLITDHSSGIDALVQDSRSRGVLRGDGLHGGSLDFVSKDENVQIGDRIITSGMGGIFPKGLLLGVIIDAQKNSSGSLFQKISVKATVDFSHLETVLIVAQ